MWMNLHRLLVLLDQRQIATRNVTVFVDDHVIKPRYQRPLPEEATFEEGEDMPEDDSEED